MISTYIFSSSNLIKAEDPSLSNNSIYKENLLDSNSSMDISSSCNILDYINETEFYSNNYIHRITEQEALNTYVFQNIDGSQSTYVFDENIKYVNEIGETIEKDLTLIAKDNGFTITKNDVNLFIPNNPNDGIQLNYLGHIVTLTPLDIIDGTNAE